MDLYRIFRVSLYLMVSSGAFAISVAEQNLGYLFAVLAFGGLAYATVDSGRVRPVRMEYAAAMTLALLIYTLLPLRQDGGWTTHYPAAFAHFLCAFQVLLFFTAYRGPILLAFCGSTLAVVVTSGIMQPDVSLVVRMTCFVGLTAWTLFIHSLWRAREKYNAKSAGGDAASPENRVLPERAFWQGLSMTVGLSAACLALGFLFFYFAPRINESLLVFLDTFITKRAPDSKENLTDAGVGRDGPGNPTRKGWQEEIELLMGSGTIGEDSRTALNVNIKTASGRPVRDTLVCDSQGRVYLRGLAMSEHVENAWIPEKLHPRTLTAKEGWIDIQDPSINVTAPQGEAFTQVIEKMESVNSTVYFSMGPVTRLRARSVDQDREGVLWIPELDRVISRYVIEARTPVFLEDVPPNATAEHPEERNRYAFRIGLGPPHIAEAIRKLGRQIAGNAPTAVKKIRAITAYLSNPEKCTYTLNRGGVTLQEFLLSQDPVRRRGDCRYFASAFVLLCRCNNIPARVASGFTTELTHRQQQSNDVKIEFRNNDAHAWAEVYFANVGWVTVDPTPGSGGEAPPDSSNPNIAQTGPANGPQTPAQPPPPQEAYLISAWERLLRYNSRDQHEMYDKIGGFFKDGFRGAGSVLSGSAASGWFGAIFAWGAIFGIIFLLMHIFLRRGVRRTGAGHSVAVRARAAVTFYNDLLHVLSRRGFVRRPGQTPREFAEFVVRRGGDSFKPVMVVTSVFENVRYGGEEISQEDFNRLQTALDALRELSFTASVPVPKT